MCYMMLSFQDCIYVKEMLYVEVLLPLCLLWPYSRNKDMDSTWWLLTDEQIIHTQ